ncbi:unnamed protein product [Knipowitschia caucasica]
MNENQPTCPQAEASFASADEEMRQEDVSENDLCLPTGWKTTLPELDQVWISESLFRWSESSLPELDPMKTDHHWHYPPSPSSLSPQNCNGVPKLQQYFGHPLFLWMPHSQLNANLLCPRCKNTKLTYEGLHQELKQVFGYENFYFLASESLSCASCNQSFEAWSNSIISQLHFGVRLAFPCLLSGTLGCDNRVVRFMRAKGLDNLKWVENVLKKQYEQEWVNKKLQFMNVAQSSSRAGVDAAVSEELPAMLPFPNYDWLLQVYVQDTVSRMDEIKASITSLFGQVLTIDTSINMVLHFSGQEQPKTVWVTNVWNEHGQIITNVLTEAKGSDLTMMAAGLVQRYKQAGVKPPKALYVDSECCGASRIKTIFQEWPEMAIRLDVGHFKKGFAPGCINQSGLSYTYFMSELSQCILEWDEKDLKRLREATRAELEEDGSTPTESELTWHVKKEDMKRHCKKFVRNTQDMEQRIERVIEVCKGKLVHDLYGAPLFNSELIDKVWEDQRRHLPCLQNPPGLTLYTKTKTEKKGGRMLPVYQCARGKEFMKRFSQHMKKFHADKQKSPSVFQALLLDGLSRWNAARAGKSAQSPFSVRSSALAHSVNQLALLVCGEKVIDDAAPQECSGDFNSGDNDMEMAVKPCASSVQEPDCPREEQPQEEKPLLECENSALDFPDSNNTSTENAKCTEDASLFLTIVKVEEETLLSPCKEEDMESPIQPPNNIDMTPIKSEEIKVETLSDDVKEEPFLPPCSDEVLPAPVPAPVTPEQTQVAHTANAPPAGHFLPQQLATPSSLFITAGLPITSQRLLLAPVQLTAPPPPAPQKLMPILSAPAPQPLVRYVVNNAPGVLLLQPTTVSAPLLANASTIQHAETRGKSHRRILSKKL